MSSKTFLLVAVIGLAACNKDEAQPPAPTASAAAEVTATPSAKPLSDANRTKLKVAAMLLNDASAPATDAGAK